jgi:hypothetical protein
MKSNAELARGRASYARRAWMDAYTELSAADSDAPLEPEDLECLATAAYLVGPPSARRSVHAATMPSSNAGTYAARRAVPSGWGTHARSRRPPAQ